MDISARTGPEIKARATAGSGLRKAGLGFDWAMSGLSLLLFAGVTIDIWSHNHGRTDETFFTPWHALLYTALLLNAVFLVITATRHRLAGASWRRAMPVGYWLSLLGVAIFASGGLFDLLWHSLFGFEADIEALLSPAHIWLAAGGLLIVTGPLRAAWRRPGHQRGWQALGPSIVAMALVLSVLTLFTQYAHPLLVAPGSSGERVRLSEVAAPPTEAAVTAIDRSTTVPPLRFAHVGYSSVSSQSLGVASILLQSAILVGSVLLLVRRWELPAGAFTFMLGLNGLVMMPQADNLRFLPAVLIAGVTGDLLLSVLRPSLERRKAFHLFAFSLPVALFSLYFLTIDRTTGIVWSTHLWTGSIVLAGTVGLLLSFLVMPSPLPEGSGSSVEM